MRWNVDPILADLGFVVIRWYTVWFVTGLLCVWHIGASAYQRRGMPRAYVPQFIMLFTVGIVLGGHVFHLVFYEPESFLKNQKRLLQFGTGMASHGSFLGILACLGCGVESPRSHSLESVMPPLWLGSGSFPVCALAISLIPRSTAKSLMWLGGSSLQMPPLQDYCPGIPFNPMKRFLCILNLVCTPDGH